jgi:hypothetical protein
LVTSLLILDALEDEDTLKAINEDEKDTKDLPSAAKSKTTKDTEKSQETKKEIDQPVSATPTKTVNAPKSSKRGRGRSRK